MKMGQQDGSVIDAVVLTGSNGAKAVVDGTGALKTTASFSGTIDSVSMKDKFETLVVRHTDFAGKVSGRVYDIPHIARGGGGNSLFITPTTLTENNQAAYDNISSWDGNTRSTTSTSNGQWGRQTFSFDVLTIAKRTPGKNSDMSVSGLRNDLRSVVILIVIYGFGANSGVQTNSADIKLWNKTTSTWDLVGNTTASSATLVTITVTDFVNYIDDSGFIHVFAHPTYASDGTIASEIRVDYTRSELTMVANFLNNDHVSIVDEQILSSVTVTAGATTASWMNVDTSRCEEYAVSVIPGITHTYSVSSVAVGRDNVELDLTTDKTTLIASAAQGKKRSERTKVPARKVNIYVTNGDVTDRTYYGRFLRYGVKGGQFV